MGFGIGLEAETEDLEDETGGLACALGCCTGFIADAGGLVGVLGCLDEKVDGFFPDWLAPPAFFSRSHRSLSSKARWVCAPMPRYLKASPGL